MSQSESQTGHSPPHHPEPSGPGLLVWGGIILWGLFTIPGVWAIIGLATHAERNDPGDHGPHGYAGVVGVIFRMVVLVGSYIVSSIIALALPVIYSAREGPDVHGCAVFIPALFNLGELVCFIVVNKMAQP